MTWLRAVLAAGLSVLLPGAGHAVVRDWTRALMFSVLFLTAVVVFVPIEQLLSAGSVSNGMSIFNEEVGTMNQFVLSFIILFAAIDATFRAMGFPPESTDDGEGPSCPECGRTLDEDLTFCHWCTTEIEQPATEEAEEADEEPIRS